MMAKTNRLEKNREKQLGHQIKEKEFGELLRTPLGTIPDLELCLCTFISM